MTTQDLAAAIERAEKVLRRSPKIGLHDDSPATARWEGGTRFTASHPDGMKMQTDMPTELGGTGDQVTPGWLMRAGLASCAATRIAMAAASERIELELLEVTANSRSDVRGLLGMTESDGSMVPAAPRDAQLNVRISAPGISSQRLRELVEYSYRCSPVPCAIQQPTAIELRIAIGDEPYVIEPQTDNVMSAQAAVVG